MKAEEDKDMPTDNLMKNGTTKTFDRVVRRLKEGQSEGWTGEKDGEVHEV